jgi:hypothetical protein
MISLEEINRVPLFNQNVWDANPEKAKEEALCAIAFGGFDTDCIDRRVGNYEGQIMAIRRGWVDQKKYHFETNEEGFKALKEAGKRVPSFLPVLDSWHGSASEYCAFTVIHSGERMLQLFEKAIAKQPRLAMDPLLRKSDVVALRDFLNKWLEGNK